MPTAVIIPPTSTYSQISSEQISVVIQGPVAHESIDGRAKTKDCLQSIRQHLPQSEIILSTWDGSDVSELAPLIDHLILSPDPGGIWNPVKRRYNNVNRMIRSTSAGIAMASRAYCLKFRTDLKLESDRVCRIDLSSQPSSIYKLFSAPMTTTTFYVRDAAVIPMLFHPSDIVQFGLTSDLRDFWDQPLVDPNWLIRQSGPVISIFGRYAGFTSLRLVPEQVVTLQWLAKRRIDVLQSDIFDIKYRSFYMWSQLLLRNFRLIDAAHSGVSFYPRLQRKKFFTDAANLNEETFAEIGLGNSDWQIRTRWLRSLISKYVGCFLYKRYYSRLLRTYRLYRAWRQRERSGLQG